MNTIDSVIVYGYCPNENCPPDASVRGHLKEGQLGIDTNINDPRFKKGFFKVPVQFPQLQQDSTLKLFNIGVEDSKKAIRREHGLFFPFFSILFGSQHPAATHLAPISYDVVGFLSGVSVFAGGLGILDKVKRSKPLFLAGLVTYLGTMILGNKNAYKYTRLGEGLQDLKDFPKEAQNLQRQEDEYNRKLTLLDNCGQLEQFIDDQDSEIYTLHDQLNDPSHGLRIQVANRYKEASRFVYNMIARGREALQEQAEPTDQEKAEAEAQRELEAARAAERAAKEAQNEATRDSLERVAKQRHARVRELEAKCYQD